MCFSEYLLNENFRGKFLKRPYWIFRLEWNIKIPAACLKNTNKEPGGVGGEGCFQVYKYEI